MTNTDSTCSFIEAARHLLLSIIAILFILQDIIYLLFEKHKVSIHNVT